MKRSTLAAAMAVLVLFPRALFAQSALDSVPLEPAREPPKCPVRDAVFLHARVAERHPDLAQGAARLVQRAVQRALGPKKNEPMILKAMPTGPRSRCDGRHRPATNLLPW